MTNVKNNSDAPVHVGATRIRPGTTARVERWNIHRHNDVVRELLSQGAIEVVDEAKAPEAKPVAKKQPRKRTRKATRKQTAIKATIEPERAD